MLRLMLIMISSCSNVISKYRNNLSVNFGSIERTVYKDKGGCNVNYCNDTRLLRDDLNWNNIAEHIIAKGTPQKIYCYACSDGSEAYSIVIALISKLGYKEACKYFPIIAKDIDLAMIERAKNGVIHLSNNDLRRLDTFKDKMDVNFIEETNHIGIHKDKKIYKVSGTLRNCVDFSYGDLSKDAENLDFSNTTLFFRNVWPYLPDKKAEHILKILSEKFNNKSSLVVGAFDHFYKANTFNDVLFANNLIMTKPQIYIPHNLKTKKYDISLHYKFLHPDTAKSV